MKIRQRTRRTQADLADLAGSLSDDELVTSALTTMRKQVG